MGWGGLRGDQKLGGLGKADLWIPAAGLMTRKHARVEIVAPNGRMDKEQFWGKIS